MIFDMHMHIEEGPATPWQVSAEDCIRAMDEAGVDARLQDLQVVDRGRKIRLLDGRRQELGRLARVFSSVLESKSPSEQLSTVLRFYRPLLRGKYDDYTRRGRDLEHLQAIAKRYKSSAKWEQATMLPRASAGRPVERMLQTR